MPARSCLAKGRCSGSSQGRHHHSNWSTEIRLALQPLAVVAVGIAFGVDETKKGFSDVLVSNYSCDYESSKIHHGGHLALRGARPPASHRWVKALAQVDAAQRNSPHAGSWPQLRPGGLLTGEKLVDDLDYRNSLQALAGQDDIVGGEMEAAGIFHALDGTGIDWIVVKAICDFADGKKGEGKERRQADAAHNAAQVVKAVFDSGLLSYSHLDALPNATSSATPGATPNAKGPPSTTEPRSRRTWRAHIDQ